MICPFCDQGILTSSPVDQAYSIPIEMGICRFHRPFIVGVLNKSISGHYGYWIAASGIQVVVDIGKEATLVHKFRSMYERCGKKYAKKQFPLFCRGIWCYAHPFFDKHIYTINYMMDVSPESFNDVLKKIERLKVFL